MDQKLVEDMFSKDLANHQYQIDVKNIIGTGAFSKIYRATRNYSTRSSVVKVLSPALYYIDSELNLTSNMARRYYENEKKAFDTIEHHRNVVQVLDMFSETSKVKINKRNMSMTNYYLVMEYAIRGTMKDYIRTHGRLSEDEGKPFINDLVNAVCYLHSKKLFHLDIKVENLLLFKSPRGSPNKYLVKMCDFGLATSNPQSIEGSGTFPCMAPEVMFNYYAKCIGEPKKREEYQTILADLYSMGCTIFFFFHGYHPVFQTNNLAQTKVFMERIFNTDGKLETNKNVYQERFRAFITRPNTLLSVRCSQIIIELLNVDPNLRKNFYCKENSLWLYGEDEQNEDEYFVYQHDLFDNLSCTLL